MFGLAFATNGVEFLQLGKVSTGCILLGGLFVYDIFWVRCSRVDVVIKFKVDNMYTHFHKLNLFNEFRFQVFGTEVMVTVAKSFDAPIKLVFPQDLLENGPLAANNFAMLGLGDIVIPGIFIAMM